MIQRVIKTIIPEFRNSPMSREVNIVKDAIFYVIDNFPLKVLDLKTMEVVL